MRFGDDDRERGRGPVRLGAAIGAPEEAGPPVIVPCRECGTAVELSRWAYDFAKGPLTDLLAKRGEPPIEDGEIARCRECHAQWHEKQSRARQECDAKASAIVHAAKKGREVGQLELDWLRKSGYANTAAAVEGMQQKRKSPIEAEP